MSSVIAESQRVLIYLSVREVLILKDVALITGASSGIGLELAKIHASKRRDLILVARRLNRLEELKEELSSKYGVEVIVVEKDLSKIHAATELYETIKETGVQVDFLINNAGFGGHGRFHERDWDRDFDMIQLNIAALTELTRCFLPEMVERKSTLFPYTTLFRSRKSVV